MSEHFIVYSGDNSGHRGVVGHVAAFYRANGLSAGSVLAVAFSGGADSVALLAASRKAGYECVALHCNFHLRGEESNRDEAFARSMAARLGCEIRVRHFDVDARRKLTGESVEMACRELRYRWFEDEFAAAKGAWGCIAVGHHSDDNVETFFLNLLRGTGLKGLCGIASVRGIFMRPLLDVPRDAILSFLEGEGLQFVVDSTNLSNDYKRNVLRNRILPAIEQDFPMMRHALRNVMENLRRDRDLLDSLLVEEEARWVDPGGVIDLAGIARMTHASALLYHLLNRRGEGRFGHAMVEAMLRSASESGRVFRADNGEGILLLDRGRLVPVDSAEVTGIQAGEEVVVDSGLIENGGLMEAPLRLRFRCLDRGDFHPCRDSSVIWLDADAVKKTGLKLRCWRHGDRMQPFGMGGSRLVSDILSDAKMSLPEKNECRLLCAGERILWIPGIRASRHFSVGVKTCNILQISLESL